MDFDLSVFNEEDREWLVRNNMASYEAYERYWIPDPEKAVCRVIDVQALLIRGLEFSARYKGYGGFLFGRFHIDVANDDSNVDPVGYNYYEKSINEFGKNAMFGPFRLEDVVDKWTITDFIYP